MDARGTYTEPVSGLDRGLRLCESIGDLAAAWGQRMIPQHRQAILDLQRMLAAHAPGAKWMLVGAVALMHYLRADHQRTTFGVDAAIEHDDLRAWVEGIGIEEFHFAPGRKILPIYVELLHLPDRTPVQLMHRRFVDVPGMFDRIQLAELPEGTVPVADPADLAIMKIRALGGTTRSPRKRNLDRADVISLLADVPGAADRAKPRADANELAVLDDLARQAKIEREGQWLP